MGLDGVEIVLATEEAFGVSISDAEASECFTPRKVIDLVWSKLRQSDKATCHSQRAFYILRNALVKIFNVSRNDVKPTTPIRTLIPNDNQKNNWQNLRDAVHARSWPSLCRPKWLKRAVTISAFCVLFSCFAVIQWQAPGFNPMLTLLVGIVAALLTGLFGSLITRPFRRFIPIYDGTVKDIVPYVQTSDDLDWSREEVARIFKNVVIEQLGIKESIYTEDSKFIEDFGLDQ